MRVVQARLGHFSPKTSLDVCGHPFPYEEDRSRQAIGAAFESDPDADDGGVVLPVAVSMVCPNGAGRRKTQ